MSSFEDLHVESSLIKSLQERFSIAHPTEIQSKTIPAILNAPSNTDFLVEAQTGSGKTIAFSIPIIQLIINQYAQRKGNFRQLGMIAIVLAPTKELAQQIYSVLENITESSCNWIVPGLLNGTDKRKSEKARIRKGMNLVVGTPGRILDHLQNTENFPMSHLQWIVMDEADRLLDMGFEQKITKIVSLLDDIRRKQSKIIEPLKFLLCSATLSMKIRETLSSFNRLIKAAIDKVSVVICNESDTEKVPVKLTQHILKVPTKLKLLTLFGLLLDKFQQGKCKILCFLSCCDSVDFHFCLFSEKFLTEKTAKYNDKLVAQSTSSLLNASIYKLHGNLEQSQRNSVIDAFRQNDKNSILFCTDVAARGLDIPCISCIIQYEAPSDTNDYIHRIGRTARKGNSGEAILFLLPNEESYIEFLRKKSESSFQTLQHEQQLQTLAKKTEPYLNDARATRNIKSQLSLIYSKMQTFVATSPYLFPLAKQAFVASVRAYATHQKDHRDFFKISEIHLGHLAKSFCLSEAPSKISRKYTEKKRSAKSSIPKKRTVGEFDSGI